MNKAKIIFASLLTFVVAMTTYSVSANEIQKQIMDPVFKINDNCSAVVVKSRKSETKPFETLLATASHCVPTTEGTLKVFEYDGHRISKETIYRFDRIFNKKHRDLALIKLRDTTTVFPVAKLADKERVELGDAVFAVGFPKAVTKNLTAGMYLGQKDAAHIFNERNASKTVKKKAEVYTMTSVPVVGGYSGGGLFQKVGNEYELIGINSKVMNGFEHNTLHVPLDVLKEMLKFREI